MKARVKKAERLLRATAQKSARSRDWFVRMFYSLAAAPVALIAEVLLKKSSVISVAGGVILLSVMASVVFYSWAMFKSFHYRIFCHESDAECQNDNQFSSWRFLLARMGEAIAWLLALVIVIAAIFFAHVTILKRMPEEAVRTESIQAASGFISENLGTGIFLGFSVISLLFQAIVLISITYTAAAASHLNCFARYKTLAGIFVFVLLYFFENDFSAALKKIMISGLGGIERVMAQSVSRAISVITGTELAATLIITGINLLLIRYFLKKTEEGRKEWKK